MTRFGAACSFSFLCATQPSVCLAPVNDAPWQYKCYLQFGNGGGCSKSLSEFTVSTIRFHAYGYSWHLIALILHLFAAALVLLYITNLHVLARHWRALMIHTRCELGMLSLHIAQGFWFHGTEHTTLANRTWAHEQWVRQLHLNRYMGLQRVGNTSRTLKDSHISSAFVIDPVFYIYMNELSCMHSKWQCRVKSVFNLQVSMRRMVGCGFGLTLSSCSFKLHIITLMSSV